MKTNTKLILLGAAAVFVYLHYKKGPTPTLVNRIDPNVDFSFNFNDAIMRGGGVVPDVATGYLPDTALSWQAANDPRRVDFTNMVLEPHGGLPDLTLPPMTLDGRPGYGV